MSLLNPTDIKLGAAQSQKAKRAVNKLLIAHLEMRARSAFIAAMGDVLKESDVLFLTAMGICGRKKMLDVFIKQCKLLKKEIDQL